MIERIQAERIIFQAIDRVNEVLLEENMVSKEPATVLLGQGAVLDSMGFVNFVVALEEELAQTTGLQLNLVEALNTPGTDVPEQTTVGELTGFLLRLTQAKS